MFNRPVFVCGMISVGIAVMAGNFVYAGFFSHEYAVALERTYFQALMLLVVAIYAVLWPPPYQLSERNPNVPGRTFSRTGG